MSKRQAHMFLALVAVVVLTAACGKDSHNRDPRPRVLIIGDSISLGFTPAVAALLKDRARVVHSPGNARHTWYGMIWLDKWLGDGHWDVIQFNWGLWDMCYRRPGRWGRTRPDKQGGKVTVPLEDYRRNLEQLVARLEQTGAVLVWASTTAVPPGDRGRFPEDAERYNKAAAAVMAAHGIRTTDLFTVSREFSPDLYRAPGDVHFKAEGYRRLAVAVADGIAAVLPSR